MTKDHRERLKDIRSFSSLVKYLRDELDWPIESNDFEDLIFDYTAEELGIDPKNAAKIDSIKRFRPLTPNQPWGIFFVSFEPKRLPVVALRRILNQIVVKKRAATDREGWEADDLLFISACGEADHRQISVANFSNEEEKRLPTLKVLGWDNLDTNLHLDYISDTLHQHLSWPDDDGDDVEMWRESWRKAFTIEHGEQIRTSSALAMRLAELAKDIRDRLNSSLAVETPNGPLRKLMRDFQSALVQDLTDDDFADMYAQTIAYGLLSARITQRSGGTDDSPSSIPVTNPFLKELLETFLNTDRNGESARGITLDFDELGVNEVVRTLDHSNIEAVVRDFGDQNPKEDPVIHFYELFLKEYDSNKRMQRGVFYTPLPIVSYIVRSVDDLLRTNFGLKDGLADTTTWKEMSTRLDDLQIPEGASPDQAFVQILDPATGTGTFLVEVIDLIHKTMVSKWQSQSLLPNEIDTLWNKYVPKHLLPRLFGYELLMAPYSIAHLKIGLKLSETGYRFGSDEPVRIYLTNSLEPPSDQQLRLDLLPALAGEAQAVNAIKRNHRFTVVIGNPPYSASISEPPWLMKKMDEWKRNLKERKVDLNREEWKFLRLAEHLCELSGCGVIGNIINRDFLDGITKRRMREHLQGCFPVRLIYDLNGDVKGNIRDENVFEIQQGVCVVFLAKTFSEPRQHYRSIVGTRESKYDFLTSTQGAYAADETPQPVSPYFAWVPSEHQEEPGTVESYETWQPITSIFPLYSSGIQTKRDSLTIKYSHSELWDTVREFNSLPVETARSRFELGNDVGDWTVAGAKNDVEQSGPSLDLITQILYRPFDPRFTYWTGKTNGFLARPRREIMRHVVGRNNIGIIFNRQIVGDAVSHFGVSRIPICHGTFYLGNKGQDYYAPLYLFDDGLLGTGNRRANLSSSFLKDVGLSPEQVLGYVYAVCWSPNYRIRHARLLKQDFPRIPETSSVELIYELASLGEELMTFHLMESSKLNDRITTLLGPGDLQVEKVSYSDETVWIDKGKTRGFQGVADEVWNFRFGGYQVCQKWLKDRQAKGGKNPRPGRVLTAEETNHYQKIVVVLSETIRIMGEIDEVIDQHGGWPEAFQTS